MGIFTSLEGLCINPIRDDLDLLTGHIVAHDNILRIGVYELLYASGVPPEVALDEAVVLAKKYGTEQAQSFINGILDRIWKDDRERAAS